ncbi:hypothetical protein [Streptomyces sp. NPDC049881]|uniref:hypothetical protein n=1 Tax=unclassified Streptomyces TaxID=2593676 RepID=UPI003413384D
MSAAAAVEVVAVRRDASAPYAETTAVRLVWLLRAHRPRCAGIERDRVRLRLADGPPGGQAAARAALRRALANGSVPGWAVERRG